MHPLLIPLALLGASLFASKKSAAPSGGPTPTPPPGGVYIDRKVLNAAVNRARVKRGLPPITAQPIRSDPYPADSHPDVIPAAAARQAAVDAAVSQAIRDAPQPTAAAPAAEPDSTKKAAANALLQFLIKTGRFGSAKDKPAEIKAAQRDLGVKPDGIVGPKTRAAAQQQGVALPPKP